MRLGHLNLLAMMAGCAVFMQSFGAIWPGPGYLIAAASSLPMILSAWLSGRNAIWAWIAAAAILVTFHMQEAVIFGLLTGPFGLVIGWGERRHWSFVTKTAAAGLTLTGGIVVLTNAISLAPLGPSADALGLPVYLIFALLWAALWVRIAGALTRRLRHLTDD